MRTDSAVGSLISVINSQTLNEFRFQFAYDNQNNIANNENVNARITECDQWMGRGTTEPRYTREKRFQFMDNLSLNRGRHEFKTGVDFSVIRIENFFPGFFGGQYHVQFNFQLCQQRRADLRTEFRRPDDPTTHTRQYAGFVQDNWRVRSNLNLAFGLRYELETYDTSQLVANPLYPATGQIPLDKNNWAPRFGFSWSPGMLSQDRHSWRLRHFLRPTPRRSSPPRRFPAMACAPSGLRLAVPFPHRLLLIPTYPNRLSAPPNVASVRSNIFVFAPDFVNPYVQQGSLALQRQLAQQFSGRRNLYRGQRNAAESLARRESGSAAWPRQSRFSSGSTQVGTGIVQQFPTARPLAAIGAINTFESAASSIYHGMIVSLSKRWSQNYQFQLSYTLSKTIDDGPDALIVTTLGPNSKCIQARDERAPVGHRPAPSFRFQLDLFTHVWFSARRRGPLFNGWKFGAISTLGSGRPVGWSNHQRPQPRWQFCQ